MILEFRIPSYQKNKTVYFWGDLILLTECFETNLLF